MKGGIIMIGGFCSFARWALPVIIVSFSSDVIGQTGRDLTLSSSNSHSAQEAQDTERSQALGEAQLSLYDVDYFEDAAEELQSLAIDTRFFTGVSFVVGESLAPSFYTDLRIVVRNADEVLVEDFYERSEFDVGGLYESSTNVYRLFFPLAFCGIDISGNPIEDDECSIDFVFETNPEFAPTRGEQVVFSARLLAIGQTPFDIGVDTGNSIDRSIGRSADEGAFIAKPSSSFSSLESGGGCSLESSSQNLYLSLFLAIAFFLWALHRSQIRISKTQ